ncbi:hypothetical protein ACQPZK_29380 [Micromonospora sp. CA-249363]|uniref:hypothetical protein n=1 Tax=Micromonospora sp. CA-249363 TaxID=3239963 RepID=UPI003D8D98BF
MDESVTRSNRAGRKPRHRIRWLLLLGGLCGALTVGVALGSENTGVFDGDPPSWATNLGGFLLLAGLVIEIVTIVWLVRRGGSRADRTSTLWRLSWSRRWTLSRQVRRDDPAPGEDVVLLGETARAMIEQRRSSMILIGVMIMSVGQAFLTFAPFFTVTFALLALLAIWLYVFAILAARRAEVFLRTHPDL